MHACRSPHAGSDEASIHISPRPLSAGGSGAAPHRWLLCRVAHNLKNMFTKTVRNSSTCLTTRTSRSFNLSAWFTPAVAVRLRYMKVTDKNASLYGDKRYMVFYGHQAVKPQVLCNIENFVILKFVISRFNCTNYFALLGSKNLQSFIQGVFCLYF